MTTVSPSSSSAAWGITLLRVRLGAMWMAHALPKLFVFTLPGTAQFFTSNGLPAFLERTIRRRPNLLADMDRVSLRPAAQDAKRAEGLLA